MSPEIQAFLSKINSSYPVLASCSTPKETPGSSAITSSQVVLMMHPSVRCPPMVLKSSRERAMWRWHLAALTVPLRLTISQCSGIS